MEVYERLDDLVDLIEGARGVPLSDSCVVNRTIALELLEAVRALMPASLRDAATILADRDDVLEDAAGRRNRASPPPRTEADATLSRTENRSGRTAVPHPGRGRADAGPRSVGRRADRRPGTRGG